MHNNKQHQLNQLHRTYLNAQELFIEGGSNNIIFGEGNPNAIIVFIGEAPGAQEDAEGRPFVGRSGKLLNNILQSINVHREEVFITNIVKCRPPNNRKPTHKEILNSRPLLLKQIEVIAPRLICTLGASALEGLIDQPAEITKRRGALMHHMGLSIIPTYHPAFALRNPHMLPALTRDILLAYQQAISGGG